MKRRIALLTAMALLQGLATAGAAQRGTPEYESLKAYKKAERDKKSAGNTEKSFWQKEAERSGLAGGAMALGRVAGSVVPLEKPNAEK